MLWPGLGYGVVAVLACVVLSSLVDFSTNRWMAMAHDGIIILLTAAWIVAFSALATRAWLLAACAGILACVHLLLVVPRLRADTPLSGPNQGVTFDLIEANAFVDNRTPSQLAQTLLERNADVLVVVEWNSVFAAAFDAAGGQRRYPHRLIAQRDGSDYIVGVVSRHRLEDGSGVENRGPLTFARAIITLEGAQLSVIGIHPTAVVERGGFSQWERQIEELIRLIPTFRPPFVIAGDLNGTTARPKIRRLLAAGLTHAHESLGAGLSGSFKLSDRGLLSVLGPLVRLDHALLSSDLRAVHVENLPSAGSDHHAFALRVNMPSTMALSCPGQGDCGGKR